MNELSKKERTVGSFLGAAVGDALGWPNEDRSHRVRRLDQSSTDGGFVSWFRRRGWMAQTFEEPVRAGEYSDDTQLILATARSLRHQEWRTWFAEVELPTWLLYERGGGSAVKRAARSWSSGKPPWKNSADRGQYWSAGGNGVCMRILPHVASQPDDFQTVSAAIIQNGIATHGHPRALMGAVVYGLALWECFRQETVLEFGHLIETLLDEKSRWSDFSEEAFRDVSWMDAVPDGVKSYRQLWKSVSKELTHLLETSRSYIEQGALEVGDDALRGIGAFDRNTGAAGTVTACASIFLASRYAASPKQGLRVAGSLIGVDTDTIASMTGAILGALHGREFLNHLATTVQDATYIETLAGEFRLPQEGVANLDASKTEISRRRLQAFTRTLKTASLGDTVALPDNRMAKLDSKKSLSSRRGLATMWRLATEDGQTLIHSSLARGEDERQHAPSAKGAHSHRIILKLCVADLQLAREFYEQKLMLQLTASSPSHLEFSGLLVIEKSGKPAPHRSNPYEDEASRLVVDVDDLKSMFMQLMKSGTTPGAMRRCENGGASFQVTDPFGNRIEVFSRNGM